MGESGEGILQPVLKKEMVETGGGGGGASKYYFILSLYIIKTGLDEFSRTGQDWCLYYWSVLMINWKVVEIRVIMTRI